MSRIRNIWTIGSLVLFLFCGLQPTLAQTARPAQLNTKNLIIVTLDGFRWQEVYRGAEKDLLENGEFTHRAAAIKKAYWADTPQQRRQRLLPFFWSTLVKKGRLYGNRDLGNRVNVKNNFWFSYPGYNEIFTGFPDPRIDSNGYPPNPNVNVLEFLNRQPGFKGQVAAFTSWNAFPHILNESRSGILVNSGYALIEKNLDGKPLSPTQRAINDIQRDLVRPPGGRLDALTYAQAHAYLAVNHPRVLYIAFGQTDHFAHAGRYDEYLDAAHEADAMIGELWQTLQSDPHYKDTTTLFITVDHGRGLETQWTRHGKRIAHSDEIWFAVIGPDTTPLGEIKAHQQWCQNQFAQTFASFLGNTFKADHPIGEAIPLVDKP
jgi:hypothetical protein